MNARITTAPTRREFLGHLIRRPWRYPWSALAVLLLAGIIGLAAYFAGWQIWGEVHYRAALRSIEQATSSQTRANLEQALAQLKLCLQVRPRSLDTHFLAARTARRLHLYDEAEEHLSRCKKLDGVPEALSLEQALIQVQRADLGSEGFLWACVQKDHPDKLLILEALALGYLQTYRFKDALAALDLWLKEEPHALQAYVWRAELNKRLSGSDYLDAIHDSEQALALDANCDEARLNLAEVLLHKNMAREAAVHFAYLIDRQPGNVAPTLGLAKCKYRLGEAEEARKLFDRLLRVRPEDPEILSESAKLLLSTKQFGDAEEKLRRSLRVAPYEREALFDLSRCLELQGRKAEAQKYRDEYNRVEKDMAALKEVTRTIMESHKNPDLRRQAAQILLRNGKYADALMWLNSALLEDRQSAETWLLLAECYQKLEKPEESAVCRANAAQLQRRIIP
ncbi:MAG: tetratricopeptide repeat protein [Planctomycetota bacterium]|nr:MAG: tetratricopeptide repeat protein [Planctomycetota bacterium]